MELTGILPMFTGSPLGWSNSVVTNYMNRALSAFAVRIRRQPARTGSGVAGLRRSAGPSRSATLRIMRLLCHPFVRSGSALIVLGALAVSPAASVEVSLSGFGTLGYSLSNQAFAYDRFIVNSGTFRRDSVIGLQMDANFGDGFAATVQVKGAPSSIDDRQYQSSVAWAFLAYRPTNDWLIRVGRQRMPLYLHSANFDVGVTYDFARLPTEMYSISPNNEIDGLSFTKSWSIDDSETTLDGFWGQTNADVRLWSRYDAPPLLRSGPMFRRLSFEGGGLVLSHKRNGSTYRIGYGSVMVRARDGNAVPVTFPFVNTVFPGVGYYKVDDTLPGPEIPTVDRFRITSIILGTDLELASGYRIVGEFARTLVPSTALSTESTRGYVSLLKRAGNWTPYVTLAFLKSSSRTMSLYKKVNNSTVPGFVPAADKINFSQRAGADQILAFDQRSLAVGASYALSPTSKIKAELMRVRIGEVSSLVDAPPGTDVRNKGINVISLSYSLVF